MKKSILHLLTSGRNMTSILHIFVPYSELQAFIPVSPGTESSSKLQVRGGGGGVAETFISMSEQFIISKVTSLNLFIANFCYHRKNHISTRDEVFREKPTHIDVGPRVGS